MAIIDAYKVCGQHRKIDCKDCENCRGGDIFLTGSTNTDDIFAKLEQTRYEAEKERRKKRRETNANRTLSADEILKELGGR